VTVNAQPERDSTIRLADGRTLAFCEWGPADGDAVIALYGTPGSRLFCPDVETTNAARVRLICVDRPGYGRSDPSEALTVLRVADDLAALHEQLRLPPCPVFGWSGGGPYALGFGYRFAALVTTIGVAASWGPLRDVPGAWASFDEDSRRLFDLAARDPQAARPQLEDRTRWYGENPDEILDAAPGEDNPDNALLRDEVIRGAMRIWFREGARQGSTGFDSDWIATYAMDWGFRVQDVRRPTFVWWGDADRLCDEAHTKYLATSIPAAQLTIYPGEGHLAPINHWADILTTLRTARLPKVGNA
jgi:pimeloyl-ACP methyl ester carboxylesterase